MFGRKRRVEQSPREQALNVDDVPEAHRSEYRNYTIIPRAKQLNNGSWIVRIVLEETRDGEPRRYDYTRSGNPTRDQFTETLCALEGASGGVVTSSGMSAGSEPK